MNSVYNIYRNALDDDKQTVILMPFFDLKLEYSLAQAGAKIFVIVNNSDYIDPTFHHPNIHYVPARMINKLTENINYILCPDRVGMYKTCYNISRLMQVPIIIYDLGNYEKINIIDKYKYMQYSAYKVVSATKSIQSAWQVESTVIPIGINSFEQSEEKDIDSLVCGTYEKSDFYALSKLRNQVNCKIVGHNPGLSIGTTSIEEYRDNFSRAKIYLNISTSPRVTYELAFAMMAGCVIISNKTSLNEELHNKIDCGIIINDIDGIESGIKSVIHRYKTLGQNARKYALKNFDINRFNESWFRILKERGTYIL